MINFIYLGGSEDFLDIYSRSKSQKSGEYEYKLVETLSHYYNGTSTMVPIESCNDKWCKFTILAAIRSIMSRRIKYNGFMT